MRNHITKLTILLITTIFMLSLIFSPINTPKVLANSNNLTIDKTVEPTDEERVFKVTYTVESKPVKKDVDIVLVLDRSNSMLYPDGEGGLVVDHVREAALNFVSTVFESNPNSRISVVDYGAYAFKNNYGNFSSSESKVKDIINDTLKVIPYKYRSSSYTWYQWGFYEHWANHAPYDGATNIKDAFNDAAWIMDYKARDESEANRAIILFTDGAATRGGNWKDKDVRAQTHNSNTIAAYNAGIDAQSSADVITVGYFNGISDDDEREVAVDTLKRSQNAGFYNAPSLDELDEIFSTINKNLNYVGTNGLITDLLSEEFEIVSNSFIPSNAMVTTKDIKDQSQIDWEIGTIGDNTYELSFKIRVKDEAYPTGMVGVPVSEKANLTYTDTEDKTQILEFPNNLVDIPPVANFPRITLSNAYNQNGYLVGDTVLITNQLSFSYDKPFEFKAFVGNTFVKELKSGSFETDFTFIGPNDIWTLDENKLIYSMNSYDILTQRSWTEELNIELQCNVPGTFEFKHDMEYSLVDIYNKTFEQTINNVEPETIHVREGSIIVKVVDNHGQGIKDLDVTINDLLQPNKTDNEGVFKASNLKTDIYEVEIDIPSGYTVDESIEGITVTSDNKVKLTTTLDYENAEHVKEIRFINQPFENVKVLSRDNEKEIYINKVEIVEAKVEFTTKRTFEELTLILDDTIVDGNINIELEKVTEKVGSNEVEINGFKKGTGNEIIYDKLVGGNVLPAGNYVAYIKITPSSFSGEPVVTEGNPWFEVFVPTILAAVQGSSQVPYTINGQELDVWFDNEGPVITLTPDTFTWSKKVIVTADITSSISPIIEYKCAKGKQDISFFTDTINEPKIKDFNTVNTSNEYNIVGTFIVKSQLDTGDESKDGIFIGNDIYTVYTKDIAGNESIKTLRISNLYTILPDLT